MKVDITIQDQKTGLYFVVPVLPETIMYTLGEKAADTVNILSVGDVDFLRGKALDTFDMESFFPAKYDPFICVTRGLKKPLEYRKIFNDWKNNGNVLQLIIPAAGINMPMTLRTFVPDLRGAQGDIYYTAGFKQHKTVKPRKISLASKVPPSKTAGPTDRPKAPEAKKVTSYTVKKGDCLTQIAKQLGIKDWRKQLYEPNKKPKGPLGNDPDLIYPGQVLKIT